MVLIYLTWKVCICSRCDIVYLCEKVTTRDLYASFLLKIVTVAKYARVTDLRKVKVSSNAQKCWVSRPEISWSNNPVLMSLLFLKEFASSRWLESWLMFAASSLSSHVTYRLTTSPWLLASFRRRNLWRAQGAPVVPPLPSRYGSEEVAAAVLVVSANLFLSSSLLVSGRPQCRTHNCSVIYVLITMFHTCPVL